MLPYTTAHYERVLTVGQRKDLLTDERVKTARARIMNGNWLYGEIATIMKTQTTEFWTNFCEANDIPSTRVVTLQEMVEELPIAEHDVVGSYRQIPASARFSATPVSVRRHAPLIGQHNDEVLLEVGLTPAEIDVLRSSGALRHPSDKLTG